MPPLAMCGYACFIPAKMLPSTLNDLDRLRAECRKMVTKRAALSAGASLVPIPGLDILADVGLLAELLPEINEKFGLSPEQIEELDPQMKMMIANIIINTGPKLAGKLITKEVIASVLKRFGSRLAAKQVVKYVPIAGQAVAGTMSFAAMKWVGNQHINECYELAKRFVETSGEPLPPQLPPPLA